MDEAIPHVDPRAWVIASAEDGVVLHEERTVLEPCQPMRQTWLTGMGLTLHATKSRLSHTLDGAQPGVECLGLHIRQDRVGQPHAGQHPYGHRLGFKTLRKPAKANLQEHLAEIGRLMQRAQAVPQGEVIRQLTPKMRGWAHYDRSCVSQAVDRRLDHRTWEKLRRWAHRRHPTKAAGGGRKRSWHRLDNRLPFATSATDPDAVHLRTPSEGAIRRHINIRGNRSPYEGDGVDWRKRRGWHPSVSRRLAKLRKEQHGRCRYCQLGFHHDDRIEIDHVNGDRREARYRNLQALHGHCHDAKTRACGDSLPRGMRDKHPDTEERRARKRARSVLEQREAERSAYRL